MPIGLWVQPGDLDTSGVTGDALPMEACESASYILWALSGRKFSGTRLTTEVYESPGGGDFLPQPVLVNGLVINQNTDTVMQRIRLRGQPVVEIISVRNADNQDIDSDLYRLMDRSVLVLDNTLLATTLTVTYAYGIKPPAMGQIAARHLAQQFLNLWTGGDCDLPQRVTSVSRQGLSMSILDTQDFLEQFRTGIYTVDLFLKSANPAKAHMRAKVFSPDRPRVSAPSRVLTLPDPQDGDLAVSYASRTGNLLVDVSEHTFDPAATFQAILRSPSRSNTVEVAGVYDPIVGTISLDVPFSEAAKIVTAGERGSWDLYSVLGDTNTFITNGTLYLTK